MIACDVHPISNLRVLKYLTQELGVLDEARTGWIRYRISSGLRALEAGLASAERPGRF